jgi:hypothetical protein
MASLPAGMPRSFRDCRICYRYGAAKLFVRGGLFYERRVGRGVRLARSFFLPLVLSPEHYRCAVAVLSCGAILSLLAFERIPIGLAHFQEPDNSLVLAIASGKREPRGTQE